MPVEPTGKPDFETYLRRIGRTGRFGKNGIAVNFIDGSRSMNVMKKIEEHFGRKISLLETNDVEELEKLNWDLCYVKIFLLKNRPFRTYCSCIPLQGVGRNYTVLKKHLRFTAVHDGEAVAFALSSEIYGELVETDEEVTRQIEWYQRLKSEIRSDEGLTLETSAF